MSDQVDPIQAAIAAAQKQQTQAAANLPATTAAAPGGAVSTQVSTAAPVKLSMEQMSQGGMAVDKWFKVTEDGIKIGDSKLIQEVLATIDMTEGAGFVLKYAIKGGNPAQYAYTTDMANAVGGGSWEAAQNRIRGLDPKAQPYRSVDLPFTLIGEVKDMSGAVVGKEGDLVGYTTSTTNWANWQAFHKEVADAGLLGQRVTVKLTAQARSNKNGNNWGVMKFDLVNDGE